MMSKEFPSMTESIEAHQEMMAETTSTAWTEFVGKLRSEVAELATLRAQNQTMREALEAVVEANRMRADLADLQNMPRAGWYNKAQSALKLARG